MNKTVETEKIDLPLYHRGKVRDVYNLGENLLIVASDRISAFDFVLPTIIPDKGKILHKLSMFWFDFIKDMMPNHIITGDFESFPKELRKYPYLRDRSALVKKAKRVDIECIVRGYLSGSGWKSYKQDQAICGIKIEKGLLESSKLPQPIFTPTTKEEGGKHDENISFEEMAKRIGNQLAESIRDLSIKIYTRANSHAETKGIILADTKYEFGLLDGKIILIDEILTPDSSRFWEKSKYIVGKSQDSLDKQYVRDYLESIQWVKRPPVPSLPEDVVKRTKEKYLDAYRKLTGKEI
ncbi:MAG: phosphoribosylaminoimidazolesuccinocarboxamide synthase [Elusimicrobia bacterium]|nr:phosphoribosylaminoimidazolesuccinocarboxamide synthase [Candidatus Liberimonas magnetica]